MDSPNATHDFVSLPTSLLKSYLENRLLDLITNISNVFTIG